MARNKSREVLEAELRARSHALSERVKELECLHSVSDLLRNDRVELGEIFEMIVNVLPSAWQFPDSSCARISLKSRSYQSQNFREECVVADSPIIVRGEKVGVIEVGYVDPLPDGTARRFLPEEQDLLQTVAQRLAEVYLLKEAQQQLTTYQQHLRSLAMELTLAEERERRQLALHLHDSIGQGLAVTKLKLETLHQLLPPEHQDRTQDVITLVQQIIADTRRITADISPPILYELAFDQALGWLGDHYRRQFGLRVEVIVKDRMLVLSEGIRVMLFRSIQELMTNVVKHARANNVQVMLTRDGSEAHACVADDGVGFDLERQSRYPSASGGFGLFSIRERFAHLGGRISIESQPGKGTRVDLWLPTIEDTGLHSGTGA